jgi:hypothetical protein
MHWERGCRNSISRCTGDAKLKIFVLTLFVLRDSGSFNKSVESLANEVVYATDKDISLSKSELNDAVANVPPEAPKKIITKKPGRAFRHKLEGKFLAESGKFACHLTLVLLPLK